MKILIILFGIISCNIPSFAQEENRLNPISIETNSFWDNWYGQVGVDMNLLFPYEKDILDVFPNGKSFGVNIAVGKWFTPEFGGRLKINWGNGIFKNDHNTWLRPFEEPGENHRKGGFMTFLYDCQFNLLHIFGAYQPDKKWNLIFAPRVGGWLDIGSGKGCPILGVGVTNNYRLNDRWRAFADVGYHFMASINSNYSSGKGHGSNGFLDILVGLEMDLSSGNKFHKTNSKSNNNAKAVVLNSFWDNWFIQLGLGMSFVNPYGTNFANVIPNGNTYGLNISLGKWFSPDAGIRGGLNWQNGIIVNHHASYLEPEIDSGGDPDKHGFVSLYADMLVNLHNVVSGYDNTRKWDAVIFPRMGLARNFSSSYKECPILGIGTEQTFKIGKSIKLYADLAYQVTTSGFLDGRFHTGENSLNSNGWFDLNVGVQYELGQAIGWDKPGEKRTVIYTTGHNWPRFVVNTGASVVVAFGAKTALKGMIKEERPDHTDNKSFPSGHAAIAFAAARSIDKEFRKDCIWIPLAGYAAATAVGIERVASDRHHWYDVVAGAGLGIGAAELTWWLSDLMFGKGSNVAVGSSGNTVDVVYNF